MELAGHRVRQRSTLAAWTAGVVAMLLGVTSAQAARLYATLDRGTIRVGDNARLTLNFEDGQPNEAPSLPQIPNLDFRYGGQGTSISLVNGRQTTTFTLTYFVLPSQPGTYVIPPITAPVGSDRLTTQPLQLRVLKADESVPDTQGKLAFLELQTAKTEAYVGEVLPLEIRLYLVSGQDLQMQPLGGEGFTFGKATQLPQRQVQLGGTVYYLVALKTTAIPNKAGDLTLGPAECRVTLRVPTAPARRQGRDLFDDFFADPFGPRYELRPVKLASEPLKIQVRPLPQTNVPPNFTGAVGLFTLSASATPTNIAVGEPIKLKVEVRGVGALDSITLPPFEPGTDFTTYPPTSQVETTDALGIEGTKTFQFDLVPQSTSVREIPRLAFSFFDPTANLYRTLAQPAIPVLVRPSGSSALLTASRARGDADAAAQKDIVHIKTRPGTLATVSLPHVYRPAFLAVQILPILWLAGVWAWRKRRDHLAHNPQVVRRHAVRRQIQQGLRELRTLAQNGNSTDFFALAFRLLQEQLGERLNLPAASITEAVVDEQLRPRGASPALVTQLHDLLQACNQERYAPSGSRQDLAATLAQLEEALETLRRLRLE